MKLIAFLAVFYPLIIPTWEKGPLRSENTKIPERVYFTDEKEVKYQIEQIKRVKDPRIKSKIVFDLSSSNNPLTSRLLTGLLDKSEEKLRTDILLTLYSMRNFSKVSDCSVFEDFIKVQDEQIKAYSCALYLHNGGNPNKVLELINKETSPFILNVIQNELLEKSDQCDLSILKAMAVSKNLNLRELAVSVIALRKEDPDKVSVLNNVIESSPISVRASLAEQLSLRDNGGYKLLEILSKDKSETVRAFVASSKPLENRLKIILRLSKDSDFEVRKTAAVSLGNYKPQESVKRLIDLLADKAPEVRKAAEDSIIKIKPGIDLTKEIGEKSLKTPISRPSAIRVLGALRDKRFSADINKILIKTKDKDLIIRSIKALGKLDYKKSEKEIRNYAEAQDIMTRKAVACTLGIFGLKESFDTIVSLSRLQRGASSIEQMKVICTAIESMGRIADPYFNKRLNDILHDPGKPSDMRATAAWSIAKINKPTNTIINQLEKIVLERIIPTGSEPEFDKNSSRISACLAFIDMGKTNPELNKKAEELLQELKSGTDKYGVEISDTTLKEFARQATQYKNGELKIKAKAIPTKKVRFNVRKIK